MTNTNLIDLIYTFCLNGNQVNQIKANPKLHRRLNDMMDQGRTDAALVMLQRNGIVPR